MRGFSRGRIASLLFLISLASCSSSSAAPATRADATPATKADANADAKTQLCLAGCLCKVTETSCKAAGCPWVDGQGCLMDIGAASSGKDAKAD